MLNFFPTKERDSNSLVGIHMKQTDGDRDSVPAVLPQTINTASMFYFAKVLSAHLGVIL